MSVALEIGKPKAITTNASTAGHATEVTFPPRTKRLTIYVDDDTDAGRWSSVGTHDEALGADYMVVPTQALHDVPVDRVGFPDDKIFLGSAGTSTVIRVVAHATVWGGP